MARDDDPHHADEVPAPPGADVWDAEPVKLELAAGLCARRHLDRMFAVDGGDRDGVTEHGLGDGHRQLIQQVLTAAHEVGMRLHAEAEVEIAGRAAARAGLPFTGEAERDVVVDTGWDGDLDGVPPLEAALATTDRAGFLNHLTLPMAGGTRGHVGDLPEDRLHLPAHLPGATTRGALRRGGSGTCAGPAALGAGGRARHLDRALGAEHRLLERDLDVHAQVVASLRAGVRAPASA